MDVEKRDELRDLRDTVKKQTEQIKQLQYILSHHTHPYHGAWVSYDGDKPTILINCPKCGSFDSLDRMRSNRYRCTNCGAIHESPITAIELSQIGWL